MVFCLYINKLSHLFTIFSFYGMCFVSVMFLISGNSWPLILLRVKKKKKWVMQCSSTKWIGHFGKRPNDDIAKKIGSERRNRSKTPKNKMSSTRLWRRNRRWLIRGEKDDALRKVIKAFEGRSESREVKRANQQDCQRNKDQTEIHSSDYFSELE